jgi:hypothetical protein
MQAYAFWETLTATRGELRPKVLIRSAHVVEDSGRNDCEFFKD